MSEKKASTWTRRRKILLLVGFLAASGITITCARILPGGRDSEEEEEEPAPSSAPDPFPHDAPGAKALIPDTVLEEHPGMVYSVAVTPGPDGKPTPSVTWLKPEAMATEVEARLRADGASPAESDTLALEDTSCGANSLWIYSGLNQTGNRLCLSPSYLDELSTYCASWITLPFPLNTRVCVMTWSGVAKSFLAGSSAGAFQFNNCTLLAQPPASTPPRSDLPQQPRNQRFGARERNNLTCTGQTWAVTQGSSQTLSCLPMPMKAPWGVQARAYDHLLTQRESQSQPCNDIACGDDQHLEALNPGANGPLRGANRLRQTFCGIAKNYGTNDEWADPFDITINIKPLAGFEQFIAGLRNTECTGSLATGGSSCNDATCASGAAAADTNADRCIHVEITPDDRFYRKDRRFLPISFLSAVASSQIEDGWPVQSELEPSTQMCAYGPYTLDHGKGHGVSGHSGNLCCSPDTGHDRPEIHPADALWWRHPDPGKDGWIFAIMQDDSNRYSAPQTGNSNGNLWSQGPRDVTLTFPFTIPTSARPKRLCIRHMRTTPAGIVLPVNVTTDWNTSRNNHLPENKILFLGDSTFIDVVEEAPAETEVFVSGCFASGYGSGTITVRAAVGCSNAVMGPWRCAEQNDGYLYDEIFFVDPPTPCF